MRIRILIFIIYLITPFTVNADQLPKNISKAIKQGDTAYINSLLQEGTLNVNSFLDKHQKHTLLTSSAANRSITMLSFLLEKGADPDILAEGRSALHWAVRKGEFKMTEILISYGADVNLLDYKGETVVFYALFRNSYELMKLLIDHGASLLLANNRGQKVFDLLTVANSPKLIDYVKIMMSRQFDAEPFESFAEGPHIRYINDSTVQLQWFLHDTGNCALRMHDRLINDIKYPHHFQDTFHRMGVTIYRDWPAAPDSIETNEPIMVIGDIHGKYKALTDVLIAAKVIDSLKNWKWGKGHLVFIGDIFDRGPEVTETLWFIRHLEDQAALAGGGVHVILGNHEIMVLLGDNTYLSPKYKMLSDYFFLNYGSLFNQDTELGRWLRSKVTMLKINDILFVHAGISPELLSLHLPIHEINDLVRNFLNTFQSTVTPLESLVLLEKGPFWYRNMLKEYDPQDIISEAFVDTVLMQYNSKFIIVGHSEIFSILQRFSGKLYAVNVPFGRLGIEEQLLLIEENNFYRISKTSEKELLTTESVLQQSDR
jgi:hypothetical protein